MKPLRKLTDNNKANVDMILTAIIAGVMFAIAIPIIYSVLGGFNTSTFDTLLNTSITVTHVGTPATNASSNVLTNLNTFFTIGPIYLVVVAAVGIIAAVLLLRGR